MDTCIGELEKVLHGQIMEEYNESMERIEEVRYSKTLERQRPKFERLWQKERGGYSNHKTLFNYSSQTSTIESISLLWKRHS